MNFNRYSSIKLNSVPKRTKVNPSVSTEVYHMEQTDDHILRHNSYAISVNPENDSVSTINYPRKSKLVMNHDLTPLFLNIENDKYLVNYYFIQAVTGAIINFTHLLFGPLSLIPLRFIYGKYLLHAMAFDLNLFYLSGDFTNWL